MRHLKLFRWAAVLAMTIAVVPATASAEEADTLSISGPFRMYSLSGTVGADLAEVYANGYDHGWTLTLYGITYSHSFDSYEYIYNDDWGLVSEYNTHVHATSFDFEFSGPDADVLNDVVSQQLVSGGDDGVILTLQNSTYYSFDSESLIGRYGSWDLRLWPLDFLEGVSFRILGNGFIGGFPRDADGYPLVEPIRVRASDTRIIDHRGGNYGIVTSFNDDVNIGSTEPPYFPPSLRILDGSVREGNRGKTWLDLTVSLSRYPDDVVTVDYQTADGTARKKSDYTATSGTLLFWPDEISHVISIAIKADRKREQDEDFTVRLSNAVGATINDGVATATILNDD